MIEKVGVYCRLSEEDRIKKNKDDDSNSIVNQKNMCLAYALNNNWEVVDIYTDDDFSGAGTYRPEFERLINDCKSGKINVVLCKSQSRFSRELEVIEKYLHNKFIEWGVRFVSIVDNADTNNKANKKSRQINGLVNEWYLEDLADNIKGTLRQLRESGNFIGSFAPYGYIKDPNDKHQLIVDPIAAKVVNDIFDMYIEGSGYGKIARELTDKGISTPAIYKMQNLKNYHCGTLKDEQPIWSTDTVRKILTHEVYIGNYVQGRKTSLGYKIHKSKQVAKEDWCISYNKCEPIIDIDKWNKVQKRIQSHEKPTRSGDIYIFSKKVYCGECHKAFRRNVYNVKSESNKKRAYLQCGYSKTYHKCSNNRSIPLADLEEIVLKSINYLLDEYSDTGNLQDKYNFQKSNEEEINSQIAILKQEKEFADKKITEDIKYYRKLYEDKENKVITEDMFSMLIESYSNEIETMKSRIEVINEELKKLNQNKNTKQQAEVILSKYKHIDKLNKVIVDEFIDKIYIGGFNEDGTRNINIVWNLEI